MGGKTRRAPATEERRLYPERRQCVACGQRLSIGYTHWRQVATLESRCCLKISIGRCENPACERYHRAVHPAEEGRVALPHYEYGLDVLAHIGARRYQDHASAPQIHRAVQARAVQISRRNVQYLLERYEELVALSVRQSPERVARLNAQGRLLLALDGLQPDVGHEVLWVVREVLSQEVLAARSLLSSRHQELTEVLREAIEGVSAPVVGVVSDGQRSLVQAIAEVFPGVPHQLCQYHYLKQAAGPAWEADRHAKKDLKKRVRGIRPLERAVAGREDESAQLVAGYCTAVRGALTDECKAPLEPGGLRLHERLEAIDASLQRAAQKRGPEHPAASLAASAHDPGQGVERHGRRLAAADGDLPVDPSRRPDPGQSPAPLQRRRPGPVSDAAGSTHRLDRHRRRRVLSRLG